MEEDMTKRVRGMDVELRKLAQLVTDNNHGVEVGESVRVFFSLLRVDNDELDQGMHPDNPRARYWTVLFPLTSHEGQGGTFFKESYRFPPSGSAYYFNGDVMHKGTRNVSGELRYVLMAVIMGGGCAGDENRRLEEEPIVITKKKPATTLMQATGLFAYHLTQRLARCGP